MDAIEQAEERRIEAQEEKAAKLESTAGYDPAVSEGDVIVKSYSQQKYKGQIATETPLSEPSDFELPPQPKEDQPEAAPPRPPVNRELMELPENEKKAAAEKAADVALAVYEGMWFIPRTWIQISPKKMQKMQNKGEIDVNLPIPFGMNNQPVPIGAVIEDFNQSISTAFSVTQDFKDKAKPLIVKIAMKRGVGLTDEQMLGYYLLEDGISKLMEARNFLLHQRDLVESLKDYCATIKKVNQPYQSPQQPVVQPVVTQPAERRPINEPMVDDTRPNPEPKAQSKPQEEGKQENAQVPKKRGRKSRVLNK